MARRGMRAEVSGEGRPLVLVPGGVTGWLDWAAHSERLRARRRTVRVQPLNVQYGLENRPLPPDYSVKMESAALRTALDRLELCGALDMAAWSFGALVTLDYALDNPGRVRTLTLIEPPAFWVLKPMGDGAAVGVSPPTAFSREVGEATDRADIPEAFLEQFLYAAGLCPEGHSARELPQWPTLLRHKQSLRGLRAPMEHSDLLERLRAFRRPVLLVKGTHSVPSLHRVIDVLAAQLPRSKVLELPHGHAPQIVSMGEFLDHMELFQAAAEDG